jgi:streptogramin lyase
MAAGGGTKLGTSSTNSQGLVNAFATVGNLANTGNGTAPGPTLPSGATAPTSKLNTLADILAPCINSNGISGACSTLFTDATPSGGSAPTNAIDAMLAIAQHPAQNIAALFGLVTGTAPFQPTLAAAPNDWTLDIKYTGGGLTGPTMLAADATGNIWVANGGVYSLSGNGASGGANRISKFSATGSAVTGASGYTGGGVTTPFGLAIDPSGNVWTTNGSSTLSKFSSAGAAVSGAGGYTGGGLAGPYGIAINGTGFVWAANGTSLSEFQNGGTAQTGSPFGSGGTNYYCIAIDGSGNVWVTDEKNPGDVRELSSAGALLGTFSAGSQNGSWGVAIDSGAHVWIANSGNNSVTELTSAGALVSSYTGGGLNKPLSLAVDGLGNVWVANQGGNSVTELTNSGVAVSPTTGYNGVISAPFGIAVDSSGNVWVGNNASGSNSITEIVGAAAPVVTPLSVAVNNNKLGTRP